MYNKILKNSLYKKVLNDIEEKEKDRIFCRHGIEHCLDVARIAYILALENNIDVSRSIIYSTALLHDIGRYFDEKDHNKKGVEMAKKILEECDFNSDEICKITNAILNHRKAVTSYNDLNDIIAAADKLSRQCYNCVADSQCYWCDERRNKEIKY